MHDAETSDVAMLTAFFGRERELSEIASWLESRSPIALISGAPGVGKSRLIREFAARNPSLRARFTRSLALDPDALEDPALRAWLAREGPSLLVIDDAALVLRAIVPRALALASRAPSLRVVITSRRAIAAPGVVQLTLSSLDERAALALFADRARHARPSLEDATLYGESARAIVQMVSGVPAAIELVATKVSALSLDDLRSVLASPDSALWRESIGVHPRHTQLDQLASDSFAALSDGAQRLFVALSASADSVTFATVRALGGASALDPLQELIEHALVERDDRDGEARYRPFAPLVRALERDARWSEPRQAALRAHAEHFAERCARAGDALYSPDAPRAMLELDRERAHIEALFARAIDGALGARGLELGARAAYALLGYFENRGQVPALRAWVERLHARPELAQLAERTRAELRFVYGVCLWLGGAVAQSDFELEAAQQSAEALGLAQLEGRARSRRLNLLVNTGRVHEVLEQSDRALALHQAQRDPRYEATTLAVAAAFFVSCGAHDEARRRIDRAMAAARKVGDDWTLARTLASRSLVCLDIGQLEAARESVEEARAVLERVQFSRIRATILVSSAILEHLSGDVERAERAYSEVVAIMQRVGDRRLGALGEGFRGVLLGEERRFVEARQAIGRALLELEPVGDRWSQSLLLSHRAVIEARSGHGTEAAHSLREARRWAQGVADVRLDRVLAIQHARIETVAMNDAIARNHPHDTHAHRRDSLDALGLLSAPRHNGAPLFGYDVLIAARALLREDPAPEVRAIIESALTMKRVFVAQRDGAWFWLSGDDKRTDCTDAPVLQRMLAAFCARVASEPGAALSRDEFVAAVWPGEKILPAAAKNRLHVAVAQLRSRGLREVIATVPGGYALDPAVRVLVVDDRARPSSLRGAT